MKRFLGLMLWAMVMVLGGCSSADRCEAGTTTGGGDFCCKETPKGPKEVACPEATPGESAGELISTCTLPTQAVVTPVTSSYRPGVAVDVYTPAAPTGAAVVAIHGGGGTSITASKADANVVTFCKQAATLGITCFAIDYTVMASGVPVGAAQRDTLCALRYAAAQPGVDPARVGVAGFSWGGTLAAWGATALRAGWTVPGGLGVVMTHGTNLDDPTCPTAPAAGDATLVKAAYLWYPPLTWYSPTSGQTWQLLNTNGAAANHSLEVNCAASFGTSAYIACAEDLGPMFLPHPAGVTMAIAQGNGLYPGVDGDGFVKLLTQATVYDSADTATGQKPHNASSADGTVEGQKLNCNSWAVIGTL